MRARPSGCPVRSIGALCIALAAYSCRDSLGFGTGPLPRSLLSPLRGTGAIMRRMVRWTVNLDRPTIETTGSGQADIATRQLSVTNPAGGRRAMK